MIGAGLFTASACYASRYPPAGAKDKRFEALMEIRVRGSSGRRSRWCGASGSRRRHTGQILLPANLLRLHGAIRPASGHVADVARLREREHGLAIEHDEVHAGKLLGRDRRVDMVEPAQRDHGKRSTAYGSKVGAGSPEATSPDVPLAQTKAPSIGEDALA